MITTLIFDLNQVIVNFDYSNSNDKYIKLLGVNCDEFWNESAKHYRELDTNKLTGTDYLKTLLKEFNKDPIKHQELKDLIFNDLIAEPGTIDILNKLKKNYKLILLAGDCEEFFNIKFKKFKLNEIFDDIYVTYQFGISKYNSEIYEKVLNKLKISGDECLFIDDNPSFILAAKKAGIKNSIRFIDSKQLTKELNEKSIPF
jgi:glucose-1-phosphatase